MATLSRVVSKLPFTLPRSFVCPGLSLVQARAKGKQSKKVKNKKDMRRELMKEFVKKQELEKLMHTASLKAAKMGEPFDPEMLNPARKRVPIEKSVEEKESEYLLIKEWSRYRMETHKQDLRVLADMVDSREKALKELKKISPVLYDRALELKEDLFPYECVGPTATPPIADYSPPDPDE